MNVGILGTGDVGRTLGSGFAALGRDVKLGSRDSANDKLKKWVAETGPRASGGTFADAATFGEVLVLATLWSGTENAIRQAGPKHFAGKVVLDATNPLVFKPNSPPGLALGHTDSGGEQVQRWLPDARVVKVFNTVGHAHMINPSFPGGPPDMFICGNDEGAKRVVIDICKAFGWPGTIDLGGMEGARLLEPMCIVWVLYGLRTGEWNHAFKMLKR
ncbi:MAG: NAD(P)-binding domain-containing protein [Gemmatimonadetes bacterium]|nr:NAD(P)-binding domain-containing protein [Gemmatimonadota bacterium]